MIGPEFFPTPRAVAYRMLAKVSKEARIFLEPSAGRGDLVEAIASNEWDRDKRQVDCIESDPDLISVLLGKNLPVVGYDWLNYTGVCYYDAIIMNPPFSDGDNHLLKAWDFMHNGEIVCLLNEETVKNPYTAARQRLAKLIEAHGNVEYLGDCFKTAVRSTAVNVAMVYLKKVSADDKIEMWATETAERPVDDSIGDDPNMLAIRDNLGNMEHYYNSASSHFLKAMEHLRKASLYMGCNEIHPGEDDYGKIAALAFKNVNTSRAAFAKLHRLQAWKKVFDKMQFRKWLDKKQTEEFLRDIELNGNIPFTKENIRGTLENVLANRNKLFEKSVANVFDELTRYFPGNTSHTEGWQSNENYKVCERIVFPYGCTYNDYGRSLGGSFSMNYRGEIDVYRDLDRVLCVMAGEPFEECLTVEKALRDAFQSCRGVPGTCTSRFFEIRWFKKGTIHLRWRSKEMQNRFNQVAAAGKKWVGSNTRRSA
jgi:hypothetical protein